MQSCDSGGVSPVMKNIIEAQSEIMSQQYQINYKMPQKNKTIIELFNENKEKIATYLIILFVLIVIIRGYYIKNFIHPKLDKNTIYL